MSSSNFQHNLSTIGTHLYKTETQCVLFELYKTNKERGGGKLTLSPAGIGLRYDACFYNHFSSFQGISKNIKSQKSSR